MTQRKQLVSLRSDVKKWQTTVKNEEDGENASSSQSPQYLSQYLTDSSIAADISQFDFGTNVKEAVKLFTEAEGYLSKYFYTNLNFYTNLLVL